MIQRWWNRYTPSSSSSEIDIRQAGSELIGYEWYKGDGGKDTDVQASFLG